MKSIAAVLGVWLAATVSAHGQEGWPMDWTGLSAAAGERLDCMLETLPKEGAEPCGYAFAEHCWEGDREVLQSCLSRDYRAWHELIGTLASRLPGNWRETLVERGYTETQIFMSDPLVGRQDAESGWPAASCEIAMTEPDVLDQCIFTAANKAGHLADLYQKMYVVRR